MWYAGALISPVEGVRVASSESYDSESAADDAVAVLSLSEESVSSPMISGSRRTQQHTTS